MGIILFFAIFAVIIFIAVKVDNIKRRAVETMLKDTPLSASNRSNFRSSAQESMFMKNFLDKHPEYTEESLKELIKNYADQIINKNVIPEMEEKVTTKMQNDNKLDKLLNMEFVRTNLVAYINDCFTGTATFSDGKDEYELNICIQEKEKQLKIVSYRIGKGIELGF